MTDTIQRPNGKTYRPRKAPSVQSYFTSDERECIVVLRTHDIPAALELAAEQIASLELDPSTAHTSWWRLVPFDMHHSGYDQNWINDAERGVPVVVIGGW